MAIKKTALVAHEANSATPASLLLNFNGANGSSSFLDSSPNCLTVSATGNAINSTNQSKWGGSSLSLTSGNGYLTVSQNSELAMGTGDFTIETWVYLNSYSQGTLWESGPVGGNGARPDCFVWYIAPDGQQYGGVVLFHNGTWITLSQSSLVPLSEWVHLALVRMDGITSFYINGAKAGSTNLLINDTLGYGLISAGAEGGSEGNWQLDGYLDDFRVVKGIAVYSGNFIPPRGPLTPYVKPEPVAAQASLLLRFNGDAVDDSPSAISTTLIGSATPTADQKKWGSGSLHLPAATVDMLEFDPANTHGALYFPGDFTLECWLYRTYCNGDISLFVSWEDGQPGPFAINIDCTNFNIYPQSSSNVAIGPHGIVDNKWTHIAAVRQNDVLTMYVDGKTVATLPWADAAGYLSPTVARIGGGGADQGWYIDDFRVTKGLAVYTKNFNPPIAPLTPIAEQDVLPSLPASLLLRFDGTNNSTNFKDSSINGLQITTISGPTIRTTQSRFGGSSGAFNGSTGRLVVINNEALHIGTGPFTAEAWVYINQFVEGDNINFNLFSKFGADLSGLASSFWIEPSGHNFIEAGFGWPTAIDATYQLPTQQWVHLAISRDKDSVCRLFVDGQQLGSVVSTANLTNTSDLDIGGRYVNSEGRETRHLDGYIDDLRIIKGRAVYTENFTPPTAPVDIVVRPPEGTPASLLLHFDGANGSTTFVDSSNNATAITANGALISTAQSKWGGMSGYFNGDSYIEIPNSAMNFGSDDFTVEAWLYIVGSGEMAVLSSGYPAGLSLYARLSDNTVAVAGNTGSGWIGEVIGAAPPSNQWTHMAWVRRAGVLTIYVDGQNIGQTSTFATTQPGNTNVWIGGQNAGGVTSPFNGYIDDLRITKGLAAYTDTFVPPTAPLSPYAQPAEVAAQASLLLHFDGNFNDSSGNFSFQSVDGVATTTGTPAVFGQAGDLTAASLLSNEQISIAENEDFTIELWNNSQYCRFAGADPMPTIWAIDPNDGTMPATGLALAAHDNSRNLFTFNNNYLTPGYHGITPTCNVWQHIAVVRHAGVLRTYINGVFLEEIAFTSAVVGYIRLFPKDNYLASNDLSHFGYIDDFRIVKGLAVYTGNFIPPEAPLSPIAKPKPVEAQSSLLLHFNGANGSATFKDSSVNALTVTANGNAQISTEESIFRGSSGRFVADGDCLTVPYSEIFNLVGCDWTIECWIRFNDLSGNRSIFSIIDSSDVGFVIEKVPTENPNDGDKLFFYASGAGGGMVYGGSSATRMTVDRWYHCAVSRSGNTTRVFVDGILQAEGNAAITELPDTSVWQPTIGAKTTSIFSVNGYIDEFRVVKGLAVYTGPFTPPKKPLDGIASPKATEIKASLLLHMDGPDGGTSFVDSSVNKMPVTLNGNPQTSTSQSKFGGASGYFAGNGNNLVIPYNSALSFGASDFTIEFWMYWIGGNAMFSWSNDWYIGMLGDYGDATGNKLCLLVSNDGANWNVFTVDFGGGQWGTTARPAPKNQWCHVAITRQGNTWRIFIDGSEEFNKTASDAIPDSSGLNFHVGGNWGGLTGSIDFNGYMDDFRVVKGYAVYTGPFTPPNRPWKPIESKYDKTLSPVSGCTDPAANNYNSLANVNDGGCAYEVYGCMDAVACNYNSAATVQDSSCQYISGALGSYCTQNCFEGYDEYYDPCLGSYFYNFYYNAGCTNNCTYGCTDPDAANYDPSAQIDDGNCTY